MEREVIYKKEVESLLECVRLFVAIERLTLQGARIFDPDKERG